MKRITLLLGLLLCGLIMGCGAEEKIKETNKEIDISAFVESINEVNPVENPRKLDDFAIENEMGLTIDIIEKYQGIITNSFEDCSLIFIAKAKSGNVRELKNQLTEYLNSLSANDLYVEFADKIAKTKEAKVLVYDDYVVLVIAGLLVDYQDVTVAINEAFGE